MREGNGGRFPAWTCSSSHYKYSRCLFSVWEAGWEQTGDRRQVPYLQEFFLFFLQRHPLGEPGFVVGEPPGDDIRQGGSQGLVELLELELVMVGDEDGAWTAGGVGAVVPQVFGTSAQEVGLEGIVLSGVEAVVGLGCDGLVAVGADIEVDLLQVP